MGFYVGREASIIYVSRHRALKTEPACTLSRLSCKPKPSLNILIFVLSLGRKYTTWDKSCGQTLQQHDEIWYKQGDTSMSPGSKFSFSAAAATARLPTYSFYPLPHHPAPLSLHNTYSQTNYTYLSVCILQQPAKQLFDLSLGL